MSDFRLKVFQSVAKNLSFTKASQELFVSQPAITKHIQELEAYYQTRLFDRQGSKISLTKSGELLLKHSEKILDDYKQLEYEMHLLHNEYIGELKLGASTTIAQYVLPPLLADFIAKFPQINLSLINGNSRGVEAALQEHRIDLGLVEGIFRLPNLKYTPFLQDELVAVVHTHSKLAVSDEIAPLCQQAMDLNFDGLIVESHCNPDCAWSDASQQVTPDVLDYILNLLVIRTETQSTESLAQLRKQIDECDDNIIQELSKRMRVAREIGTYKKEHGITVLQAGRYNEILEKRGAQGEQCGMDSEFMKKIFEAIHEESVRQQMEIINK